MIKKSFIILFSAAIIYLVVPTAVVLYNFQYSPDIWEAKRHGKRIIGFYSVQNGGGEYVIYKRTLEACKKMGIAYLGAAFNERYSTSPLLKWPIILASEILYYIFKPSFNLVLTHLGELLPKGYNVLYINLPTTYLMSDPYTFYPQFKHVTLFNAYADIRSISMGENPEFLTALRLVRNDEPPFIPLYIAMNDVKLILNDKLNVALITGTLWGGWRSSNKFKRVLASLAEDGLLEAYGASEYFGFLKKKYHGPFNEETPETELLDIGRKYAISLIAHTAEHISEEIPTSRISEGICSGAIVISDMQPFIMRYFGDSVLYFDQTKSEASIYSQIREHILWVRNNPALAHEKIQKSYDIWQKNFTIEKQLQNLIHKLDHIIKN